MEEKNKERDFVRIVQEHERIIYKVCSFYVSKTFPLADLYQEVVCNLWNGFLKFREAIAYLIFFALLFCIYKNRRGPLKKGFLFGLSLILIFTFRFFIEFLKHEQVGFEKGLALNMGQLLSIPFVLTGIYLTFFYKGGKQEKNLIHA